MFLTRHSNEKKKRKKNKCALKQDRQRLLGNGTAQIGCEPSLELKRIKIITSSPPDAKIKMRRERRPLVALEKDKAIMLNKAKIVCGRVDNVLPFCPPGLQLHFGKTAGNFTPWNH